MSPDSTSLDFDHALDLFVQILPTRALHTVCATESEIDRTNYPNCWIQEQLDRTGLHTVQIIRQAIREVLAKKEVPEDTDDIFSIVDPEFRGDGNPLLGPVRLIVSKLIS